MLWSQRNWSCSLSKGWCWPVSSALCLSCHAVPAKSWEYMIFVLIRGVWMCISTSPGLLRLSPRLFLLIRDMSPLPSGMLRPVQCFSLGSGRVEPMTKIHHTRDGVAPSRSQRRWQTIYWAPLWFRGSLASPAPPRPCSPGTTPHAPALMISGCGGKSFAVYPI